MTKRKPIMTVADLACRVEAFAKEHHWIRGQNKAIWGPPGRPRTSHDYAYCAYGYIREVADEAVEEGFNRLSVRHSEKEVTVLVAEEIQGGPVPPQKGVVPTIITFNDAVASTKDEVVAKFTEVCRKAKEMIKA